MWAEPSPLALMSKALERSSYLFLQIRMCIVALRKSFAQ
jgi:hypothetical protein